MVLYDIHAVSMLGVVSRFVHNGHAMPCGLNQQHHGHCLVHGSVMVLAIHVMFAYLGVWSCFYVTMHVCELFIYHS